MTTLRTRTTRASLTIESWLLAPIANFEPGNDYDARLLAEDDDGNWLIPGEPRDNEPWWQGYWRWYKPTHWPPYFRSLLRRSYVMVERV